MSIGSYITFHIGRAAILLITSFIVLPGFTTCNAKGLRDPPLLGDAGPVVSLDSQDDVVWLIKKYMVNG